MRQDYFHEHLCSLRTIHSCRHVSKTRMKAVEFLIVRITQKYALLLIPAPQKTERVKLDIHHFLSPLWSAHAQ